MARARTPVKDETEGIEMSDMLVELDDDLLGEVLQSSRAHGNYDTALEEFINSNKRAVQVNIADGTLGGKKPASVKTGFEGAKKRATEGKDADSRSDEYKAAVGNVKVISHKDNIFLVRQDIAA